MARSFAQLRGTAVKTSDSLSGLASINVPEVNGNSKHAARKILFSSVHSILDFSNGASVATMDMFQGLTTLGVECQAFCTAKLDQQSEVSFEKMIADLHEPYEVRESVCGDDRRRILYTRPGAGPDDLCSARDQPRTPRRARTRAQFNALDHQRLSAIRRGLTPSPGEQNRRQVCPQMAKGTEMRRIARFVAETLAELETGSGPPLRTGLMITIQSQSDLLTRPFFRCPLSVCSVPSVVKGIFE